MLDTDLGKELNVLYTIVTGRKTKRSPNVDRPTKNHRALSGNG